MIIIKKKIVHSNSLGNISIGIMCITLLSKAMGFFREIVFSYYYGTTNIADAYVFSLTISTIVFGFIGSGLTTSFIPVYSSAKKKGGVKGGNIFTSRIINLYVILCALLIVVLFPNTHILVRLLASGFDAETAIISSNFCKYSVVTIIATGIVGILTGFLQANNSYLIPAAEGLPLNVVLILSIFFATKNYYLLGLGNLIAAFVKLLFIIPALKKTSYRHSLSFNINDDNIKTILKLAVPIIVSASVNQINVLVDKSLASAISGGVSTLNYAHTVISIVNDVIVASFITVAYPKFTKAFINDDISGVKKLFCETFGSLLCILIPVTAFLLVYSNDVVAVLFGRGAFNQESIFKCSEVLKYYAIGIPFVGIRQLLIRLFYAKKDTKTPVINASIALCINIFLNFPLKRIFGLGGLALATSLSAIIADVLLWYSMRRKINLNITKKELVDLIKIVIISILIILILRGVSSILQLNLYLKMFVLVMVGASVFFIFTHILKAPVISKFRGVK